MNEPEYSKGDRVELGELSWPRHRDQQWQPGRITYVDKCEIHIKPDDGPLVTLHKSNTWRLRGVCVSEPSNPCACLKFQDCLPPGLREDN